MAVGQLLMAGRTRQKRKKDVALDILGPEQKAAAVGRGQAKADAWMASPERARSVAAGDAAALMAATPAPRKTTAELLKGTEQYLPEAEQIVARRKREVAAGAGPGPLARGDPFGRSRGTGLGPTAPTPLAVEERMTGGVAGRYIGQGTNIIQNTRPGVGAFQEERPDAEAQWGEPIGSQRPLAQGMGYVRQREGYPTRAEQMAPAPQTWQPGGPHGTQAVAALRAQRGPWEGRRDIEQVATGQAGSALMRAQAMAGVEQAGPQAAADTARLEAEARGAGAMGTILEGQALPAQRMLELWKTPEGQAQVMQEWQSASQAQKAQMAGEMLATYGEFLDPEVRQALQEAATGMRIETYDGEWWTGGGLLGGIADLFMGFFRGRPERRRAVPAPRAAVMGGPTAGGGAGLPDIDESKLTPEQRAAIKQWAAGL